jgi:ankyrin repeat protein
VRTVPVLLAYSTSMRAYVRTVRLFWCVLGDVARVEKVISKGADINAVDETFGDTPLVKAVINCHKDVVALLLRCEASISVVNRAGETALPIAERDSTPEIARMLRCVFKRPFFARHF